MKNALIIVDMQKGFLRENTKHLPSKIVHFANCGNFATVLGTQYINYKNSPCYVFEGWSKCMPGSGEEDLLPEIYNVCDTVFSKDKYTCWNDEMKDFLYNMGIDRVVFVGVNTGCCVLHSAFDSYNDLFETLVIRDLCGSTSGKESHEAALKVLSECITKERVLTSDTYMDMVKTKEEERE